jgi:transposase
MPQALRITYRISAAKLEQLARQERDPRVRVRLLAMRLVKLRHPATAAAESLGLGLSQTCVWVKRFNQSGPAGLHEQKRAPRRSRLAVGQVEAFKARVRQGARPEDGVSVLRGPDFQRILQREFDAQVSLGGTYYILHKLGFASLVPRPQHPQSDPAAQAAFKKKAPRSV